MSTTLRIVCHWSFIIEAVVATLILELIPILVNAQSPTYEYIYVSSHSPIYH